jgi:hypothetical protein
MAITEVYAPGMPQETRGFQKGHPRYGGRQKGTRNFSADHAGVASGSRSHLSRSNCFARWSQARATSHAALTCVSVISALAARITSSSSLSDWGLIWMCQQFRCGSSG